jgi:sialidase-1
MKMTGGKRFCFAAFLAVLAMGAGWGSRNRDGSIAQADAGQSGTGPGDAATLPRAPLPVVASKWNGYQKQAFTIAGHAAYVVMPHVAAPGKPWVWRTSFPDYQPVVDLELVRNGYHIGYIEVLDMLGSDSALDLVDQFYAQVRSQWGLAEKMAVEPCSRGGLPAYRYAARHPERVACIYGDVPVMDFKSWPLKWNSKPTEWPKVMSSYGFKNDAEAMAYPGNPIDQLAPLAKAGIPIRHVICLNDKVVPPEQNTLEARRRLKQLGSDMEVISVKESNEADGHHFPYPDVYGSVRFIMDHTDVLPAGREYFQVRDGLANCKARFEQGTGRVAFLGGSITFNGGWRDELMLYFQQTFPKTKFDFIAAGIPSIGSNGHAFRLEQDVLAHGPIDLLFIEATVNDGSNFPDNATLMLRAMEGVVRHVRTASPQTDIVQMHFVMPEFIAAYNAGQVPAPVAQHEKVAEAYGCTSLNLVREVTDRINAKEFTWASGIGDVHPPAYGQRVYANSMMRMLDAALAVAGPPKPHPLPEKPIDEQNYVRGRYGKLTDARIIKGFTLDPSWNPHDGVGTRPGFARVPALVGTHAGDEFEFDFEGTGCGLFVASGPHAGIIEYSVDGGAPKRVDTYCKWSPSLYLPWPVMLDDALPPGRHTVHVRIAPDPSPKGMRTDLPVIHLLLN